jgi:spore coat protein CotF
MPSNYKADTTLNEKDSLQDVLNAEKTLVKLYSTAMTEGCSKGFRTLIREHWGQTVDDQMKVFCQMTEHGYYKVESAPQTATNKQKTKFTKVKKELS